MGNTLISPGVQITETDLTNAAVLPTGTNILVAGFSPTGPSDQVLQVSTTTEFVNIYGLPVTPAERYFYHTVQPLLDTTDANVSVYRLPYGQNTGTGFGSYFGALVYPGSAIDISQDRGNFGKGLSNFNSQLSGVMYLIGEPVHFELTQDQYFDILQHGTFQWSVSSSAAINQYSQLGQAAFIVLNKGQTTIDNQFEGFYVGAIDNSNLTPATNFNSILNVFSLTQALTSTQNYTQLPTTRLSFALSSQTDNVPAGSIAFANNPNSISQVMEELSPFSIKSGLFVDTVSFGLFQLTQSPYSPTTISLAYSLAESYTGSFDYYRDINSNNGGPSVSYYIENQENASPNIQIIVNDFISHRNGTTWLDLSGKPTNRVRFITSSMDTGADALALLTNLSGAFGCKTLGNIQTLSATLPAVYAAMGATDSLFPVGAFAQTNPQTKALGSIPAKLSRMMATTSNTEQYLIDITVDAGLSTIFAVRNQLSAQTGIDYFDDTISISAVGGFAVTDIAQLTPAAQQFSNDWNTIAQQFLNFAQFTRGDHIHIGDLPRNFFVQGQNVTVLTPPANNFSLNVYSALDNLTAPLNTSYGAYYGDWMNVYDANLGQDIWAPASANIAVAYANTDKNFQPWFAPAGFTRGIITGVNQLAITPNQKQRDQLYSISINPIAFFPNEGFVIWGEKTMLKQPSAFSRVNVRRLFLNLEKATAATLKFFVFEPNTALTRLRIVNTLTPIFDNAVQTEGLYDYLIVCNSSNNTGAVIDQNQLIVSIYLQPVRTAEFIYVNFIAVPTGVSFSEFTG